MSGERMTPNQQMAMNAMLEQLKIIRDDIDEAHTHEQRAQLKRTLGFIILVLAALFQKEVEP